MQRAALAIVLTLTVPVTGAGVPAQRAATLLPMQSMRLDCTFTAAATGTWAGDQPVVRPQQDALLEFQIGNLDAAGGSADVMLGALTTATVMVVNGDSVHFLEPPGDGGTAITSVYAPAGDRRYRASHSRTAYYAYSGTGFTSTPEAEQYYGYCVPLLR
jgi:hypothetical protein